VREEKGERGEEERGEGEEKEEASVSELLGAKMKFLSSPPVARKFLKGEATAKPQAELAR
jgi:hypothetical protein